jgi:hypothetical protein
MEVSDDMTVLDAAVLTIVVIFILTLTAWTIDEYRVALDGLKPCTAFTFQAQNHLEYFNLGNYLACQK